MQDLAKKLQLKPNHSVLLVNAPEEVAEALKTEGLKVAVAQGVLAGENRYDAVQLFVKNKEELDHFAPLAATALKPESLLWIAYPKKSSKVKTDLTRDEGWKTVTELGYEPVRLISINETWSSMRYKHATERKAPSKMGADYPGIDRATRTVIVPEDLKEALGTAGLLERFEGLAFTHRKEYVIAVMEAKRPETRANRISKTIEQVAKLALK